MGFGNFVSLLVKNDKIIAGCNGMVYALDTQTGNLKWKLNLNSGSGYVSIVNVSTPVMDFNTQPMLHVIEYKNEEEAVMASITISSSVV